MFAQNRPKWISGIYLTAGYRLISPSEQELITSWNVTKKQRLGIFLKLHRPVKLSLLSFLMREGVNRGTQIHRSMLFFGQIRHYFRSDLNPHYLKTLCGTVSLQRAVDVVLFANFSGSFVSLLVFAKKTNQSDPNFVKYPCDRSFCFFRVYINK